MLNTLFIRKQNVRLIESVCRDVQDGQENREIRGRKKEMTN